MSVPEGFDPKQAHVVSQWPHDRPLNACRFDPQGRYVVTGSEDALVERFQLSDGVRTLCSGGHQTWVRAVAFSKDGAHFVSGGCDGKVTWWETAAAEPKPIRVVDGHKGWVRTLDVSPNGTQLVSGGNDNAVRLWNMADGNLIREFSGHPRHVYNTAFHPNGQLLFSGDLVGGLRQWDIASGAEMRAFDATALHSYNGGQQVDFGGIRAIAVSPDGKWLAAGGLYKATNPLGAVHEPLVLLYDLEQPDSEESRKPVRQLIAEGITQGVVWRLKWLADGSLMGLSGGGSGGFLLFWKPDTDKDHHRFQLPNLARDMDLHPNGLQVATAHHDRHLRITRLAAD
ncbi:MAG: WD40 repeat domain-containing protein [Planctomycetaceae bacterium]|nr:WD40 repeat domain-containing protein [Planctomycetaceae bacterium]